MKEDWYEQLQAEVAKVPQHDMLLIMGDMNANIGSDNTDKERAMGSQGCGSITNNGETGKLLSQQQLCDNHKLTWKSPDGKTVNQIDHVVINNKWRRSLNEHMQRHRCWKKSLSCDV